LALNASKQAVSVTNTGTGNNVLSASPTLTGTIDAAAQTLSGNLTLSGGTANGVLYLNGSKVATSASGLTYNGSTFVATGSAKVGAGAASNSATFMVNNPNATATGIQLFQDAQESWVMGLLASSTALTWANSGTERMRLDASGNLGIGTSSPLQRLDVAGNIRALNSGADSQVIATAPTDSFSPFIRWAVSGVRDSGILGYPAGDDSLVYRSGANSFSTGTERFRITAVGNVVAGGSVALATTATNGFLYVPTCAGTPTGTPTAITGMAPIVVNTTNNKLYFYSGGAWRDAGP
jgi:hypothetical protein